MIYRTYLAQKSFSRDYKIRHDLHVNPPNPVICENKGAPPKKPAFNNAAYQKHAPYIKFRLFYTGDQTVLFYSSGQLDQSETSMLGSARLESYRPANH